MDATAEIQYPELKTRIQSLFIDTVLIIIAMFAISSILEKFEHVPDSVRVLCFILVWVVYEPVSTSLGCTLGNYLMRIRVKRHSNISRRINIIQALVRYIFKVALGWLSFITIGSNPERRAIHDMVSGSVMIKLPS